MSLRILNRSFSGGEITPELFGRLDLSKVQEALALCKNFITLPHGPVVNRPGTEFVEEVRNSANATRIIPFSYNSTQTFAIQLGAGYFRFHTQGATLQAGTVQAYVSSSPVTISLANPAVVTWASHGLSNGNTVVFSTTGALPFGINPGTIYYVVNATTGTFQLATTLNGVAISTVAPTSTVTISIATPGVVTWNNHGLPAGTAVVFSTTGALPTGITAGTTYYVVSPTANTFQIAATPGGAAIATSGTQSGTQTCTGTQAGTQTCSRQYMVGDLAGSGGVNYYCVQTCNNQVPPNATYWYAQPANGDYEIPNPYAATDLMDIHYTQSADVLTLVHPNYQIQELRRYGATNWQLTPVTFTPKITQPVGSGATGSPIAHTYGVQAGAPAYSMGLVGPYGYVWSAFLAATPVSNDLTQPGSYNIVTWNAVAGAAFYNVYKQSGGVWYLLGTASGTSFRDDSSRTLSSVQGPSSSYPVLTLVNVAAAAFTANAAPTTISAVASGGGAGTTYSYVATAVDENGNESYSSDTATCTNNLSTAGCYNTVSIPSVAGAVRYNVYRLSYGAWGFIGQAAPPPSGPITFVDNNITPDISRTPPLIPANTLSTAGNYPGAVTYYQQRRIFAGTANQPQNVWATRSGTESDLSYTLPTRDDNRIAFKIAGREASSIRHIVPLQDLLFLSASCEWKCSSTTGVLTPSTVNVQPQSYIGANNVQPVVVGNAVLYAAARGGHIRQMNYNWQINGYQSTDSCIFAPHLFDYNSIVDMAYSRGPIPILWCVSSSGKLLGMTYLPEQQIAAWHQHTTGAADVFESICTITEAPAGSTAGEDMLYCIVRRTMSGGVTKRFVERLHTRLYNTLADCHYVDCGATYNGASNKNGTYYRSGTTTLTGSITGHGLTNGQSYWFSFSDPSLGALPTGSPYAVTVVDANTFTLPVANSPALAASNAGASGVINGTNAAFDLLGASGEAVTALSGAPALYKTDWQGNQLQYATARTNLLPYSGAPQSWTNNGNAIAVTANATTAPDGSNSAALLAQTAVVGAGRWIGESTNITAGVPYTISCWVKKISGTDPQPTVVLGDINYGPNAALAVTSAWQRFSFTFTEAISSSQTLGPQIFWDSNGAANNNVFAVWGLQLEVANAATSYIATNASPVTVTDYTLTNPAHAVFASAPASGSTLSWSGSYFNTSGTLTFLPNIITGLTWLNGMTVNILADGAVVPPQVVTNNSIALPTGATQVHVGLPLTAQLQTPPAAQSIDPAFAQGLAKNVNKVFLRTYRSSGILAGPDFIDLTPYRQRTTENPGSAPNMVTDEVEIMLSNEWGTSGQVCIQQSDPLPLDIAAMTLEIAVGGGT